MPIKPENKDRYPANWKTIRKTILDRAEHCCEFCGVVNYAVGFRLHDGSFVRKEDEGIAFGEGWLRPDAKEIKIVLTVAHLDHTPENNDLENLRALCQRCHLRYDRDDNLARAARTRHLKIENARLKVDQGMFNKGKK